MTKRWRSCYLVLEARFGKVVGHVQHIRPQPPLTPEQEIALRNVRDGRESLFGGLFGEDP
jgi:hypothetical protein